MFQENMPGSKKCGVWYQQMKQGPYSAKPSGALYRKLHTKSKEEARNTCYIEHCPPPGEHSLLHSLDEERKPTMKKFCYTWLKEMATKYT